MKMQRMMFEGAAMMLLLALLTVVLTVPACKEELGVNAVAQSRDLNGTVLIAPNGGPLVDATVSLLQCDGSKMQDTRTDAQGKFLFKDVPIVPGGTCFRVYVQKNEYVPKDTMLSCNCTNLQVGVVYLAAARCDLVVAPTLWARGQQFKEGEADSVNFALTNPGSEPVGISEFKLAKGNVGFTLIPLNMGTGKVLGPNTDVRTFRVRFASNQPGIHSDAVIIRKDCKDDSLVIPLNAMVSPCSLAFSLDSLDFGTMTATYDSLERDITVRNLNNYAVNVQNFWVEPSAQFVIVSPASLTSIPVGGSVTVRIRARNLPAGRVRGQLVFQTDCNVNQVRVVAATGSQPKCAVTALSAFFPTMAHSKDTVFVDIVNSSTTARMKIDSIVVSTIQPTGVTNVFRYEVLPVNTPPPYWVAPGGTMRLRVIFEPDDSYTYTCQINVASNSSVACISTISANAVPKPARKSASLYRWSERTPANEKYWGYNLTNREKAPDSIGYDCGFSMVDQNNDPLPTFIISNRHEADFRFTGYDDANPGASISIYSVNGVIWMANAFNTQITIESPSLQRLFVTDFNNPDKGCTRKFVDGDIVAIRHGSSNYYALVLLQAARSADWLQLQKLNIEEFNNIPLRTTRR
jgi:hypothetical protein